MRMSTASWPWVQQQPPLDTEHISTRFALRSPNLSSRWQVAVSTGPSLNWPLLSYLQSG